VNEALISVLQGVVEFGNITVDRQGLAPPKARPLSKLRPGPNSNYMSPCVVHRI
jgi:hypothetical protein